MSGEKSWFWNVIFFSVGTKRQNEKNCIHRYSSSCHFIHSIFGFSPFHYRFGSLQLWTIVTENNNNNEKERKRERKTDRKTHEKKKYVWHSNQRKIYLIHIFTAICYAYGYNIITQCVCSHYLTMYTVLLDLIFMRESVGSCSSFHFIVPIRK